MFRYFPPQYNLHPHSKRDYWIAAFTFFCVAICLITDADASIEKQNALGVSGWVFLTGWLLGENKEIRVQVLIAVLFATIGEHFASPYMGGYTYRFHNVPAYVPAGHGMVYLTAVALGRSGLFVRYARQIALFVVVVCGAWSLWGITFVGALLFVVFLFYLFKGRSPLVYLAAFFITTWLELIGTAVGTWHWAEIDPVLGLPQGNPPSGVAAWYCLVDAVAMGGSAPVINTVKRVRHFLLQKLA
jgi:nitrate reductase NapE component